MRGKCRRPAASASAAARQKNGAPASAQTIDALFAPLPDVETRGRAWLFMNHEIKPVNLRLGISDGTNTEVLGTELQQGMELVTSILLGGVRTTALPAAAGNPLMPNQRGGPPGRMGFRLNPASVTL